jgi:ABC-type molybdate transport system substrate-binding protein
MGLRDGLAAGKVDAALLGATLLPIIPAAATVVALPLALDIHGQIVFGVGVVVRDGKQHPAARPLVDFLTGLARQSMLENAGFLPRTAVRKP